MFNVGKITKNMATRRGMDLTVDTEFGFTFVRLWDINNESEWMFSYRAEGDILVWHGNVYLPAELKEELPGTIATEGKLREVVEYIGMNRHLWRE